MLLSSTPHVLRAWRGFLVAIDVLKPCNTMSTYQKDRPEKGAPSVHKRF